MLMNKQVVIAFLLALLALSCLDNIGAPPRHVQAKENGSKQQFELTRETYFVFDSQTDDTSLFVLKPMFQEVMGWEPKIAAQEPEKNYVLLKMNPELEEGAYLLSVTSNRIIMESSSREGFEHAQEKLATLLSNIPETKEMVWKVPAIEIQESYR